VCFTVEKQENTVWYQYITDMLYMYIQYWYSSVQERAALMHVGDHLVMWSDHVLLSTPPLATTKPCDRVSKEGYARVKEEKLMHVSDCGCFFDRRCITSELFTTSLMPTSSKYLQQMVFLKRHGQYIL
jgi:hypothetical protein